MSGQRYTEEFKVAAVKQVVERGHSAAEVAERRGVSIHSIYVWTKRYGVPDAERKAQDAQSDEMRRLKAELKRVTEERDILKKAGVYFAKNRYGVGDECAADGGLATQAGRSGDGSFGSGITVHQQGLARFLGGASAGTKHESTWKLSRQRCR